MNVIYFILLFIIIGGRGVIWSINEHKGHKFDNE